MMPTRMTSFMVGIIVSALPGPQVRGEAKDAPDHESPADIPLTRGIFTGVAYEDCIAGRETAPSEPR